MSASSLCGYGREAVSSVILQEALISHISRRMRGNIGNSTPLFDNIGSHDI